MERIFPDGFQMRRELHLVQPAAIQKRKGINGLHRVRHHHIFQGGAALKGIAADGAYRIRDSDRSVCPGIRQQKATSCDHKLLCLVVQPGRSLDDAPANV